MHLQKNTQYPVQQNTEHRYTEYTYMQHNTDTETSTENRTENNTNNHAQPQQNSAHNYRTYSLDLYHEYAYIKDSNTIELYTISKENI